MTRRPFDVVLAEQLLCLWGVMLFAVTETDHVTTDLTSLRLSALLVGAVALLSVLLDAASYALVEFVVFPGLLGAADSTAVGLAFDATSVLGTLSARALPFVAVLLAFSLTAVRDLPTAPALAGAALGGFVAVVGHPLAVGLIVDSPDLLAVALAREAARWVGRFVVPVLAAVLFGAVIDDFWERSDRWRHAER